MNFINDLLAKVKGWKTAGVSVLVIALGLFQFVFDVISSPVAFGVTLILIGVVFLVLRFGTDTVIGEK